MGGGIWFFLEGPVSITNTHSVGVVRDAVIDWMIRRPSAQPWALPVVAETYDGLLNDVNGFHVKAEHTIRALDGAASGPVAEGAVGGGTGMVCFGFKGGIGTSSRKLSAQAGGYTVGVLVQCNAGRRSELRIAGAPVGREIADMTPCQSMPGTATGFARNMRACDATASAASDERREGAGSIIVVVATDAAGSAPAEASRGASCAGRWSRGGKGENSSATYDRIFDGQSTCRPGFRARASRDGTE